MIFKISGKTPLERYLLKEDASIGVITHADNATNFFGVLFTAVLLFGFRLYHYRNTSCSVISDRKKDFDIKGEVQDPKFEAKDSNNIRGQSQARTF